jgi:hypothetical protein
MAEPAPVGQLGIEQSWAYLKNWQQRKVIKSIAPVACLLALAACNNEWMEAGEKYEAESSNLDCVNVSELVIEVDPGLETYQNHRITTPYGPVVLNLYGNSATVGKVRTGQDESVIEYIDPANGEYELYQGDIQMVVEVNDTNGAIGSVALRCG